MGEGRPPSRRGRHDVRQNFVKESSVTKEAAALSDSPSGASGDASDGKSASRRFHPRRQSFSSAAVPGLDMGRRGDPKDDTGQPR